MFSSFLSLVAFAPLALAAIHDVTVGGLQADGKTPLLQYTPNVVYAAVGDQVRFTFHVKNHTVTQSSFPAPCAKLAASASAPAGFDSGFMPVDPTLTSDFPTFLVTVNTTAPIWGYCRQFSPAGTVPATHCESGMVFGINPPSYGNTFSSFLANAKLSTSQNSLLPPTSTSLPTLSTVTVTDTVTVSDRTYTTTYTTASSKSTSTSSPVVHDVVVGGINADGTPDLAFTPPTVNANPGDKVRFTFHVKNHTVTESSFPLPCAKLVDSYGQLSGFDSGFMPVAANTTSGFPTFEVTVNDTKPVWGYCRQFNAPGTVPATHCEAGMVFAINAPASGNTFDKFLAAAKVSTSQNSLLPPVSSSTSTASASKSTSTPVVHDVVVGGVNADGTPDLAFTPPTVNANPGDKVRFTFHVKNHTVTESSFPSPCAKLVNSYGQPSGFDSGFMPVAANTTTGFPTFEVTVNDTAPVWGYCRQFNAPGTVPPTHCEAGMVFAINAPASGNTFDKFLAAAKVSTSQNSLLPPVSASATSAAHVSTVTITDTITVSDKTYTTTYLSWPGSPVAKPTGTAGPKALGALDASAAAATPASDADTLHKLLAFAPVVLGLLGGAVALLLALLVVGAVLLVRSRRTAAGAAPSRSAAQSYHPIMLDQPGSKLQYEGSHEYQTPRYSDGV